MLRHFRALSIFKEVYGMRKRIFLFAAIGLFSLAALIGLFLISRAAPKEDKGTIKIGVAIYLGDDTFISNMMTSLSAIASDFERSAGERIYMSIADAQGQQETQNSQIERFLSLDYDVLCVNLVDRTNAAYIIDKAMAKNVPVVFFNREPVQADIQKWEKLYYVGTDPAENGRLEGGIIVDAYMENPALFDKNKDGILQYIMIEGEIRHQDAVLRTEESVKALRDAGIQVEKLDGGIADWERSQAAALAEGYFQKYGEQIEVILCNNDDMALGVLDTVERLGLDFSNVVGIDGTPQGLKAVDEGHMLGTVIISYHDQASLIFQTAYTLSTGGRVEDHIDVGADRCIRAPMYVVKRK